MKTLFQIDVVANSGFTGRIAEELGRLVITSGWKGYIAYGRWACPSQSMLTKVGTRLDLFVHGLKSMLLDRHGFGPRRATLNLISKIKEIKLDIVHLHNLHGYYLSCEVLFDYLSIAKIPVVRTLHDCWSFTGHCVHFQNIGCEKWKTGYSACSNIRDYPKALGRDNSYMNYIEKKRLSISVEHMMIVPVCNWLSDMLSKPYLSQVKRQTIVSGIDLEVFTPKGNRDVIKSNLGIGTRYMTLAVVTVRGTTKGFDDSIYLNSLLPGKGVIAVVGLTTKQIKKLPGNMTGIERTENINQLVEIYSAADIPISSTYQDTLPTINTEALACGTPVITYDIGGSADIVNLDTGIVLKRGDIHTLLEKTLEIRERSKESYITKCRRRALQLFDKSKQLSYYLSLYDRSLNKERWFFSHSYENISCYCHF